MSGLCGRAELIKALGEGGPDMLSVTARLIGYEALLQPDEGWPRHDSDRDLEARKTPSKPDLPKPPPSLAKEKPDVPFWRLEGHRFRNDDRPPQGADQEAALAREALEAGRRLPGRQPPPPLLSPWHTLVPRLREIMAAPVETRALDVDMIVHRLGRGEILSRLPLMRRRRWGSQIQIIEDRSERLIPFWADQDEVTYRLKRLFPRHAVEHARLFDGHAQPFILSRRRGFLDYQVPPPGTLVVALSDLGCLGGGDRVSRHFWMDLGSRLRNARCRPVAVVPAARSRFAEAMEGVWACIEWEHPSRAGRSAGASLADRAERLLSLVSPAVRIEPGLLRAVRLCLRAEEADAGTEADAWQHPAVISRHSVAATLDPDEANRLRWAFEKEDERLRWEVLTVLRAWRAGLPKEIWYDEIVNLAPVSQDCVDADERQAARDFFHRLALLARGYGSGSLPSGLIGWGRRVIRRRSDAILSHPDLADVRSDLDSLWEYLAQFDPEAAPPSGYNQMTLPPIRAERRRWTLRQQEDRITAAPWIAGAPAVEEAGSLLGTIDSRDYQVQVEPLDPFWASGSPPPWASAWGRDEHGPWVAFTVEGVEGARIPQRLRWIPPGTFLMGSPETEAERWDAEGPQHTVTMAKGFWLFDTACTQALWQAVMGDNPSRFQSPDRPVETVSLDDIQEFLKRANSRVPGLTLRLPAEAEWEYACRAGTETPFSFGDIITPAQVNYDGNHPYSGGEKGLCRGETVPVASLPANAWGLYEMHGNVYEWCADHWHDNYEGAPADGSAWLDATAEAGASRVLRGGSWDDGARDVRSAYRFWDEPGIRSNVLGFRCARVQDGAEPEVQEAEPAAAGQVGQAERPTAPDRPGGAVLRRLGADGRTTLPIPAAPAFVLATDCERLTFGQITRPEWARAIGRDRFGLWTEIEVTPERPTPADRPVRQRLRWMPPGRFLMGSPKDEPGRYGDEGPQHEVTIARGFWLFDTACTQALWQAVMDGDNPSEFNSPDRPVEQVSWDDVQKFLELINARVPGLDLSLPSEAQWEYACRAGTTTALYSGNIEILGEHNAPALDPIAWYGGNSGVDFDLENGWDSAGWKEKQYDHERGGTHPVKRKAPNAWGLYDMLGNVWEWCADHWHDSYDGAPADGSAWIDATTEAGARRVFRGGSWIVYARVVRSASRRRLVPGFRNVGLGFRCARVQDGAELAPDRPGVAASYHQLGMVAQHRGDLDGAEGWYRRALQIREALGTQADGAGPKRGSGRRSKPPRKGT